MENMEKKVSPPLYPGLRLSTNASAEEKIEKKVVDQPCVGQILSLLFGDRTISDEPFHKGRFCLLYCGLYNYNIIGIKYWCDFSLHHDLND